ncbi:MAG: hypothetical protein COA58_11130 [Bacteroidetes bacterium]|nr:MAG: hypothetical protein COA58_11130 [Bacteroidota bacterium]
MQRNSRIISRLTALWALSEAGLGGVLHALQSPFTGLFVGGFAIVLISLIAYFAEDKWNAIFRALLVVLIIKLAVSPHSPPTSYLAVSFQALMAGLIYSRLSLSKWSAMLLGVVTLVESAIQKLLVLTLIYGNSLWEALDSFSDYIVGKMGFLGNIFASTVLMSIYLWLYAILGVVIGYVIYDIVRYLEYNQGNVKYQIQAIEFDDEVGISKKRKGRWKQWVIFGMFFALIGAYYFFAKEGDAVWKNWLYIFLRSTGILLLWYYVLAPIFKKYFRRFLDGKQHKVQKEVDETLTLLPYLRKVTRLAWKENKDEKGLNKLRNFMGDAILYSIHLKIDE